MPVVTRCVHCHKAAQVDEAFADRLVRCPACHQVFHARRAAEEPPTQLTAGRAASNGHAPASTAPSPPTPTVEFCPACRDRMAPGAMACTSCGWMKPSAGTGLETDDQYVLCTNPACGVANPPGERHCQRCHTLLPSAPGTMLNGRYRVVRLLAIGGFGAVYLGEDVRDRRPVAIKDMICEQAEERGIRLNFFRREAQILKALAASPIVPRFHDYLEADAAAHLVMEYIPGQDLLKVLEKRNQQPFPLDRVVAWGVQVCDVLALLHAQNPPVLHRDLKPDNLMLLDDGTTLKMIDFGTARDMGRGTKTRLASKTRVFTEGYAPPEQIVGRPEVRSDLFALAGTLYHLATGKAPEGHFTALELKERLARTDGGIPPADRWFYELLRINLSEDPNDRYHSAREIQQDLRHRRLTTETLCPRCRQPNPVREPFCKACAQALSAPGPACTACGHQGPMGCRFCTQCGKRLR
jgi:hypothetical protein